MDRPMLQHLPPEILWRIIDAGRLSVTDLRATCCQLRHVLARTLHRLTLKNDTNEEQLCRLLSLCPGGATDLLVATTSMLLSILYTATCCVKCTACTTVNR